MHTQGNNVVKFKERKKCYVNNLEDREEDIKDLYDLQIATNEKLDLLLAEMQKDNTERINQQRIMELEDENEKMKKKIKNSFPIHIITYLVICSLAMGASITLLVLRFVFKVYIVDPYYIICTLLIASTLFFTAVIAIKDWKGYMNGK